MARPPKSGLEYFPLDVDMDSDEKVAYIISRHGFIAFGIIVKLYMEIYRRGYFLIWNERQRYLLAHQLNVNADFTETIVSACINEGIFEQKCFSLCNVLTSHGIQQRYLQATGRRVKVRFAREIFLLTEEEAKGAKLEFVPLNVDINPVSVGNNPISDNRNEVSVNGAIQTEKGFPQHKKNNNPVSVDINHSFGKKSENERRSEIVSENNNPISDNRNEVSVSNASAEIPQSKVNNSSCCYIGDDDFAEVAKTFSDNIHPITGELEKDMLADLFSDYGKKWCLEAIKEAVSQHGRSVKYIGSILAHWKEYGFKAPKKQQRKEATDSGHNGRSTRSTQGKAPSKGDYSEYDEALRWQQQHRPWDVQSEQGSSGEESGIDTAI